MTDFYTLWTDGGLTKLGDATLETPFNITTAVVGNGNGADVIPNKGQVDLVNQVWSGAIGGKIRSQSDPNTIVFEFAILAADGPFTVREVGLKSDDGQLCIVGNFPVTEKPVAADGSVRDMILRIPVHFENADVVNLVIDPNITVATKTDVLVHAADSNLHVTAELLSQMAGIRGYMPGDEINLTYVPSAQERIDRGLLERNGDQLLVADEPDIYSKIGRTQTPPEVAPQYFWLMDDRGLFPRNWDHGAGIDPDAASRIRPDGIVGDFVGSGQDDAFESHAHGLETTSQLASGSAGGDINGGPTIKQTQATGGNETRPANRYKWGGIFR
jgi:hypothetical protein